MISLSVNVCEEIPIALSKLQQTSFAVEAGDKNSKCYKLTRDNPTNIETCMADTTVLPSRTYIIEDCPRFLNVLICLVKTRVRDIKWKSWSPLRMKLTGSCVVRVSRIVAPLDLNKPRSSQLQQCNFDMIMALLFFS